MAEKRDYYEVLGVSKGASDDEIKKRIESLQSNTTQTLIRIIKRLKLNLKKLTKLMKSYLIVKRKRVTTSLAMQVDPSYGGGGGAGGFGGLAALVISAIFLKASSVVLVVLQGQIKCTTSWSRYQSKCQY